MNQQKIEIINDGHTVDEEFVNSWEILDYCDQYNGKITISFVGVIIKNKNILFSFPKYYKVAEIKEEQKFCMEQILYILSKNKATYGSFDKGLKGEFPVKSYHDILNYYKKYGLYLSNESYFKNGYEGNVDWSGTINKSNKLVQKNGVIFFPFVIKKTRNKSVFISECMGYVLADASNYSDFITTIFPYEYENKNPMFRNLRYIISELKKMRNLYFKDIEKKLINNLINYLEWKSRSKDNVRLLTLKFENYWETMINEYLNDRFVKIRNDQIVWGKSKGVIFCKPDKEHVESNETVKKAKNRNLYKIQYDHFSLDNKNKKVLIFDSKYFNNEVNKLNYKQLFYHYNLMKQYKGYTIYNGLLIPANKEYYTKVHIDRVDLDGVRIIEHYINLNDVLNHYLKKI
ncbi:hypothetical protein M2475_000828 [Breznakia sp. PF5-3]|uniref:LlaJI family restriction endonuclease n=1 Tax=unclassified Breznakia TaxID=2623764 RepID=UPI002406091B|nr:MULTISPECIES: LlaJI family restriction endonuclease [unclassified Breznakia]MDF9824454.1 hypothetical protein [Breznakia sp. PM6-1]MDF9835263.1 hypothetical protein [Breznakia sp. PF5-3]MDF9837409.1 hypothetical protein [Breznakia sp. PFB2-8]MDF9859344.1 hypothetical protein [Breznakia sp. PH5-24]